MLSGYQLIGFVLFAGPTNVYEDQPLIDRFHGYVENVHHRVIESTGFGEEVVDFLAKDRDQNLKEQEKFPLLVVPRWEYWYDGQTIRLYLKKIFAETWEFFDYLQVRIAEAHPADVGRRWFRELPWKCSEFSAEVTGRDCDHTIKRLIDLVGPSCDSVEHSSSSWLFKIDLQRECVSFADRHDFNGESSNRCLHQFIIRYNNYSAKAYESFVGHIATNLYWEAVAHGLCLSITEDGKLVNATEANRRRKWMLQNLASIEESLLQADSILAEKPPPYWIVEAKPIIENAIGNETVPYPSSADAVRLYKKIHDRFQSDVRGIAALRITNFSDCQIDVLVYYPAYDSTEHCYRNFTDVILSGQFLGVNYVVSIRRGHTASWISSDQATMERYFRDSEETEQCGRIDDFDGKMENKLSDELHAVVAVKCARRFVWYELGYQYFPAAYTNAPTVRIRQASMYNSNCGMLVLFP